MATKDEILHAISTGIADVESTFGNLSEHQLDTKVHQEEGGWTARQVLAHLAGRQATYEMMSQMAQGGTRPEGEFDVHGWNQGHVDARADKSRDELIAEFKAVHEGLAQRVQAMPEQVIQQEVMGFRGPTTVGDMLMGSGGTHSSAHSEEVRNALG